MIRFLFFILIFFTVTEPLFANSFTYGGIRVQKDFRFTTQQDRNRRLQSYEEYLQQTGIFNEKKNKHKKDFKNYKKDPNHEKNFKSVKRVKEAKFPKYLVKGKYDMFSDKVLLGYSITYNSAPKAEYIYNSIGDLFSVVLLTGEEHILPHYKAVYNAEGYLQKVKFYAIDGYEYIFLSDGKFQGVVINDKLYNSVGRPYKVWLK